MKKVPLSLVEKNEEPFSFNMTIENFKIVQSKQENPVISNSIYSSWMRRKERRNPEKEITDRKSGQ
ncbi:hypothetical protein [Niallia sp. RD1]|uniref:hypothetical protein n=1 Tax=Niallia sp. RD1 TaxID=2962858 RepID=UPI0020C1A360|nr:hypothetical protein [Niallia sp. RD1]UTI42334.1 hypothetical protein NKG37_00785 [Niallia sp. RD1]